MTGLRNFAQLVGRVPGVNGKVLWAVALVAMGLQMLADEFEERTIRLDAVSSDLAARRAQLADVMTELDAQVPYPTAVDLDPVHRADAAVVAPPAPDVG